MAGGIPRASTSFVGRGDAVLEVRRLADHEALVTVVGPPGSGKTRLAVTFVELAPVLGPALVAHSLGLALGLRQRPLAEANGDPRHVTMQPPWSGATGSAGQGRVRTIW
jgi:hypothetical protein